MNSKIAFNSANLVARVSNYRFSLSNWGELHQKTAAEITAQEWNAICAEIAGAGFRAVEIWEAHADPKHMTPAKSKIWREILDSHDLEPVAYAGGLSRDTAQVCAWLGIPLIAGGGHPKLESGAPDLEEMRAICREFGVRYAFENHPEKSSAAILEHVGGGDDFLGVAIDTGWLGTQGLDAPAVLREVGSALFHLHVKDVRASGGHETTPLGEGSVDLEGIFSVSREIGYNGYYSWEDEPENRNPFEIAAQMRVWIEQRI
ncbi:MAG TPA: sugar phosphate isomerase/epimerase family protein [Abditibacterium sp.]